jgi:23S rRNA (cytidine1920-2'-O)/16S rRNA (cytidine1409-2'-O)-methyltransferase
VGKGGIVRDADKREAAVVRVRDWLARQEGWRVLGVIPSPITGGSGNLEYLIGALHER